MRIVGGDGETTELVDMSEKVGIETTFDVLGEGPPFIPMLVLNDDAGTHLFNAMDTDPGWRAPTEKGRHRVTAWIPAHLLNEGVMVASVLLNSLAPGKMVKHAVAMEAVAFTVVDGGTKTTAKGDYVGRWGGAICPKLAWTRHGP